MVMFIVLRVVKKWRCLYNVNKVDKNWQSWHCPNKLSQSFLPAVVPKSFCRHVSVCVCHMAFCVSTDQWVTQEVTQSDGCGRHTNLHWIYSHLGPHLQDFKKARVWAHTVWVHHLWRLSSETQSRSGKHTTRTCQIFWVTDSDVFTLLQEVKWMMK